MVYCELMIIKIALISLSFFFLTVFTVLVDSAVFLADMRPWQNKAHSVYLPVDALYVGVCMHRTYSLSNTGFNPCLDKLLL